MANAMVVYRNGMKKNSWARWMVNRTMKQNKNNLVVVVGKTGSGKTYSAISICEIMGKIDKVPFNIDHVVFNLRELMDLINSGTLKRGSKIVFDEPQVSISAREFQSVANKVFNYVLSTFRHLNLTLLFCTPFETLLDKNTRKLFHARFETMSINKNENTCRIRPRFIEYADFKTEPYRKCLIILYTNKRGKHKSTKLSYWDIPKPSKELIDRYEEKKKSFTENLNKNISERLKKYDESGKNITLEQPERVILPIDTRKSLTLTQERAMKVVANITKQPIYETAAKILGKTPSAIMQNLRCAEKRGYKLSEFRENEIPNH